MSPQITLAVAFMDYKRTIKAMIDRAAAIRLPMGELCARASVHKGTLYRWLGENANPRLRDLNRALDALERELAAEEAALRAKLGRAEQEVAPSKSHVERSEAQDLEHRA